MSADWPDAANDFSRHTKVILVADVVESVRLMEQGEHDFILRWQQFVRQTREHPLVRPTRGVDGRWTVDAWAPLEGRVFNLGARIGW